MRAAVIALAASLLLGILWAASEQIGSSEQRTIGQPERQDRQTAGSDGRKALRQALVESMERSVKAKAPLKGYDAFEVIILDADERIVPQNELRTLVELRLRQAGIRVLLDGESEHGKQTGKLVVSLVAISDDYSGCFACQVDVLHPFLRGDPWEVKEDTHWFANASIWQAGPMVGSCGAANLREHATNGVEKVTDQFLNAYLAANPKERE